MNNESFFQAVQYAIDKLKETVPIWKKEVYEEGGEEWKQNQECKWKEKSGSQGRRDFSLNK